MDGRIGSPQPSHDLDHVRAERARHRAGSHGRARRYPPQPGLSTVGLTRGAWPVGRVVADTAGGGRVDTWPLRMLVAVIRGRVLPRAGTVAHGVQHGQGYRFAGRRPGGRWVAAPDPDDTRWPRCGSGGSRPAAGRAAPGAAPRRRAGAVKLWIWARLAAARAAERHAEALADRQAECRAAARRGAR
jgi:hypothetical protein